MEEIRAKYGSGTVYQQGNSYVAQMYCTTEIDGKTYGKRVSGSGKTETKALRNRNKNIKKWEEGLKASLKADSDAEKIAREQEALGPSLNEVFNMNLEIKDTSVQIPTSDNYEMYYEGYVKDTELGQTPIKSITEEQLLEFYKDKRINGRKRLRKDKDGNPVSIKHLSISTVNHIRFVMLPFTADLKLEMPTDQRFQFKSLGVDIIRIYLNISATVYGSPAQSLERASISLIPFFRHVST